MAPIRKVRRFRKIMIWSALSLLGIFLILLLFVDKFVEPILRDRIHTLIVQGSDSLYTYKLGGLKANFFGGNVEVKNLQITVDTAHYLQLQQTHRLPALTMELNLQEGSIKGLDIFSLVFGKKIQLREILSRKADINLSRHVQAPSGSEKDAPLWKSIQPSITRIDIDRIKFDGIKLLYKNADTSESIKLQFDECNALFENIRIDSAAAFDTTRIGFTKSLSLKFHDLKFRTTDSSYKLKAEWITYSSKYRKLQIDSFKLQPTLETPEAFYAKYPAQLTIYKIEFARVLFTNTRLDRFLNNDVIQADSVVFNSPQVNIYLDRSQPPLYDSKIGKYPQQRLRNAKSIIEVRNIAAHNGSMRYTEKNPKTQLEGSVPISNFELLVQNATNNTDIIKKDPVCTASINGSILGTSPFALNLKFPLDSSNGKYQATGQIDNITTQQVQPLAMAMANVQINSFNIGQLAFDITGRDYDAGGSVKMRYNDLSLTMRKTDEETGQVKTQKFLTKILNKFVMWQSNPGPDGVERVSNQASALRLSTQSFFGLLWKAIFDGMQDIMMKSGRYG